MAILDIFKRKETYQGYVLSNKVDKELQKRLIEAGRGDEINSFTPGAVKKGNEMMNVTANSTPAFMVGGKNNLEPEPVKMGTVLSDVAKKTEEKIFTSPAVQKGLEKTVGYLDVTREAIQNGGVIRRDDKEILFTDLPITQQIASSAFTALSEGYGRVGLGMIEGVGSALEWQGVDAGKSISEKAKAWQDTALLSYEDMSRGQKVVTSLNNVLASTAFFYMGGKAAMSGVGLLKFSPKLAFLAAEVGALSSSALEAGIESGDIYKASLEKGENIELAKSKANAVFMANMLALYVTNRLGFFNEHIKGEFKRMVLNAPLEGLQEGMQQFFQNQALGNKWYEGVLENFGYGAFAGFFLGGGNSVKDLMEKGNLTPGGKKREELVALPDEFYQVETNEGNKYFETNKEAAEFASSLDEGSYVISQKTAEDALKIIEEGNLAAFPFEGKISATQEQANKLLAEIGEKFNLSKSESVRFFEIFQGLANNAKTEEKPAIVQEAIEQAKLNIGETPRIIEEALAEAKKGVISTKDEIEMPSEVYHQTSIDPGVIQAEGFKFGKNSIYGEAAFFKQTPDQTYGGEQIKINPSDFNLKVFPTIKSEQDFISKQGTKNLAEAIRTEGKYDGFIIPQPETDNNVFAVTNKEKLDKILDRQQYIPTKEAQDLAKSFPFLKELNIPVTAKRAIITESGQLILGKYSRAMIEFVQNPKKTTVPHEAIHAFMDLMLTESEQKAIIEEVKRRYPGKIKDAQAKGSYKGVNVKGYTENQIAEEILAEDMIRYIKTDQAPSNKLKQFYNWFVTQVKNLLGDGKIDSIEKLYEEIQKSPSYARRRQARKKMSSYAKDFSALQKEYAQNPEGLTTKFLENVDVKHREFASYEFLKNLTKSKSLSLKEVERNLIESVLDDQFKGEKKISLEDFRAAVASELMPLQVIESDTYADYGSDNVGARDLEHTTHIYNSPFNHGYSGHFGGDFRNLIKRSDVEIKQVPTTNKWAVVKAGVELTEANLQENVYHIASSEEKANEWIGKRAASNFDAQEKTGWIDIGKIGLFGHTRIWDQTENDYYKAPADRETIRYIAEIQSDSFQNKERLDTAQKQIDLLHSDIRGLNNEIFSYKTGVKESKELIAGYENLIKFLNGKSKLRKEILNDPASLDYSIAGRERSEAITEKFGIPDYILSGFRDLYVDGQNLDQVALIMKARKTIDEQSKDLPRLEKLIVETEKKNNEKIKELTKKLETIAPTKEELQFLQQKNTWHERMIREEIRRAALDNVSKLRFPTPYTIAKIEGYLSEEGQIPEGTVVGDYYDYGGEDYMVLKENQQMGEEAATVTPSDNVRGIFDYDTAREEDIDNELGEIKYEIEEGRENYYIEKYGNFSEKELEEIKNNLINGNISLAEEKLRPIAEKVIDERYTNNEDYAFYYNDEVYGEENVFAKGDNEIIIINDISKLEVMTYGGAADKGKANFNYEEDLDAPEHKTVARFYDKQVGRYLAKLRKQNFRITTDERGFEWYETDIMPEDKSAVEAFQTVAAEKPETRTGEEVAEYLDAIEKEKDEGWETDDHLMGIIKQQNFVLTSVKINDLISKDKNLRDYVASGENRYTTEEGSDPNLPIIVGYWDPGSNIDYGVLDGYNRVLTKVQNGEVYIEAWAAERQAVVFDKNFGYEFDRKELREAGIGVEAMGFDEHATVLTIKGVPAIGFSFLNDNLAGFSVAEKFRRKGIAKQFITELLEESGGTIGVEDANENMLAVLKSVGEVSEPDGAGTVTVTLRKEKYQAIPDDKRAELEARRGEFMDNLERSQYEAEERIILAREENLAFNDQEKENGYKNFKKLAQYRRWILDNATDEAMMKSRIKGKNLDNEIFSGATDLTNDELLSLYKERYEREQEILAIAREKTPTEIDQANKKTAERLVKSETTGKKPTIRQAINVAQGKVKPEVISMKETTLLKKKIRDIARGVKMGRSDMRATMIQAFRSRLGELNDMRKAIINYAEDLNLNDRGRLLPMVANAKTQLDLTKAMLRIDAALSRADKIEQLQEVRKTASLVNKAVKSGRGIAVDYQKRLIEILKDYDLKTPTTKTLNRLKSLKEYVDEHPSFVPDYVVKKLDRLSKKNPSQMTADEIRDLNETLNHMISLGHLKLSLKNKYDERVRLLNLTKLLEHTNSIDPKGDPKDKSFSGKLAKARMMLNVIHSFRVADKIDGTQYYKGKNVALQRLMSSKVNNAELSANVILEEVLGQIRAIKNNWTDKEQAVMEFYLLVEMGAHTQANELATAQGWTEMPAITEEMRTAMDLMRGTFKKSQGMTAAIYEEVENRPFEYVDNYFPLKYERRVGELPEITIGQPFVRSKKTEQGFTMKRMPNVKRTPRTDVFSQFEEAVREHQYYINVQPAIIEINSLVGSEEYRKKAGQIASQWWADYLSAMANRGQLPGIRSNAWLARKRINLSRAILGYKLSSALLQPFAIFDALTYFQFRFGQLAAGELAGHFAATWINPRYAKRVIKKSPSLTLRKGTSGELAIAEMKRGTTIGRRSPGKIYNDLALKPLQYLDLKTAAAVDQAAYKILRRQGLSEAEARAEADMVMNMVSGSSEIADRPMALMSGETMRTIFTFQTFMMNRWGLISHDFIRSGLVKGSFSKKAKALYGLFILALVGGLEDDIRKYFYEMIVGKELKDKFSFWQGAFLSLGESVPIIGQFIKGISMPGSSFSVPLTRIVENMTIGAQQLASDKPETRKKGILRLSENIAIWYGLAGTAQMFDLVEGNMNRNSEKPVETFLDEIELPALPNLEALDLPDLQNLDFPPLPALPVL